MPEPETRPPNRLARETSPYLLQHAHNPVDWHAWGPEAFATARERDVPVFLSVGYSTCYWCHVMERESFEHGPTAEFMNERFVCVKADREERPDVDEIYMAATVTMTGSGGWPMSVFLEPGSLKPFWCGTYFPREPMHGRPSFTQVLETMSRVWGERRDEAMAQADRLAEAVTESLGRSRAPARVGRPQVERAVQALLASFDRANAGFGDAPKFPQPVFLELLLEARTTADDDTRGAIDAAVRATLDAMMIGGIHDQVGGGFHRYSVDASWTVPHFEKMLYDNGQLLHTYARAAVVYDDDQYRRVVRRTAGYLLREMTEPGDPGAGGFFSAQDAEVDHREGLNYLWTPDEVRSALGADDAAFAISAYGLDASPNFEDPHHPAEPASFVLRLEARPERVAERLGMGAGAFTERLDAINAELLAMRGQRKQPHLDDKVLSGWNGLAIRGLVAAGEAVGERAYTDAAERAAEFVMGSMRGPGGELLRSLRAGRAHTPAFLEDHAFLIDGLLALHRSPLAEGDHLAHAVELAEAAFDAFAEESGGAVTLHDTRAGRDDLFVRARSTHDGAVPSGSGVFVGALLDLADAAGEDPWIGRAVSALRGMSSAIAENPVGAANATRHLLRFMRAGHRVASRIDFDAGHAPGPSAAGSGGPVAILADTDELRVTPDAPASFTLAIEIADPYHVVATDPGEAGVGLAPLRVGLVSGSGVAVYADYPEGEPYGVAGVGTIRVHAGRVEIPVAIEHAPGVGASPGAPVLGVTFQACSDEACLAPATVRLGVAVEIAEP